MEHDPLYGNMNRDNLERKELELKQEIRTHDEPLHLNFGDTMGKHFLKRHLDRVQYQLKRYED